MQIRSVNSPPSGRVHTPYHHLVVSLLVFNGRVACLLSISLVRVPLLAAVRTQSQTNRTNNILLVSNAV